MGVFHQLGNFTVTSNGALLFEHLSPFFEPSNDSLHHVPVVFSDKKRTGGMNLAHFLD